LIREFNYQKDFENVLTLWEQCGLIENEAEIVREEITTKMTRDPELFLVYELEGEILGTIVGGWDGWRGWIYKLGVSEKRRRQGIGSALVREVTRRLTKFGAKRIGAYAFSTNGASISLFEKNGFFRLDVDLMRLRL
jgi:ribosomal protein S18 acetylase RimI-like enzyme